jgi:hypothetical protein
MLAHVPADSASGIPDPAAGATGRQVWRTGLATTTRLVSFALRIKYPPPTVDDVSDPGVKSGQDTMP